MTVFQVIAAEEANFPVIMMCEILDVSRSGYYAWKVREPSARSQENTALAQEVAEIHAASRKTYGSPGSAASCASAAAGSAASGWPG